ncbi:MAG: hypothetical protein R2705_00645 [Ilumatobacteraceae bacterium]
MGVELDHGRRAAEPLQRGVDVAAREGTDPAQVLGQDDIRRTVAHPVVMERVERPTRAERVAYQGVDLAGGQAVSVQSGDDDAAPVLDALGPAALEGDSDELVAQTEHVDDLGRRWKQRDDPHRPKLPRRPRSSVLLRSNRPHGLSVTS